MGSGPVFLDFLSCEGDEKTLLECPSLYYLPTCTNQDIAVRCNGQLVSLSIAIHFCSLIVAVCRMERDWHGVVAMVFIKPVCQ